jgi:nicotinate phosphoribosyltransferase
MAGAMQRRGALLTDLYELTRAASYLRRGMAGPATLRLVVRALPPHRGFLVAGGLADCLDYLQEYRFGDDELDWLAREGCVREDLDRLAALRFSGGVRAVPVGGVIPAHEPILEVTAPRAQAQMWGSTCSTRSPSSLPSSPGRCGAGWRPRRWP